MHLVEGKNIWQVLHHPIGLLHPSSRLSSSFGLAFSLSFVSLVASFNETPNRFEVLIESRASLARVKSAERRGLDIDN